MTTTRDTKAQILEHAISLLQSKGYNGFSYRDIAEPLGIKNAAVHYHFPSKGDLAMALVERYLDILRIATSDFMANGGSAREQLENLFKFTLRECASGRSVCPIGAFSVDYEGLPETVKSAAGRFHQRSLEWLVKVLEVGRAQSEIQFSGEPEAKALELLASVQGARQLARVMGIDTVQRVVDQHREELLAD